jgi:microcystin-dependent protein
MLVTNQTSDDYWFGPLHLNAGVGTTLTVDDTSSTSLYLTNDSVADALNNLYNSGKILVSGQAQPFPRPTGIPQLLHGDGSPEGRIFAPQGSTYMRRDNTGASSTLYVKTTGVTISTGWQAIATDAQAAPTGVIHPYAGPAAPMSWILCDGSAVSRTLYAALFGVCGTLYGSGDGSSTFNVPDLRGRVPAGFAASGGHVDVSTLGNQEGTVLGSRRPKHPHTNGLTLPNHGHSHALTLPNHGHSVSDSGHTHNSYAQGSASGSFPWVNNRIGGSDGDSVQVDGIATASTGVSVGNPTSNPSIDGSVGNPTSNPAISGTIGVAGTANDAPAYLVLNYIIKT